MKTGKIKKKKADVTPAEKKILLKLAESTYGYSPALISVIIAPKRDLTAHLNKKGVHAKLYSDCAPEVARTIKSLLKKKLLVLNRHLLYLTAKGKELAH